MDDILALSYGIGRIYVTGHSNGGFFASHLALKYLNGDSSFSWIKAIAPVAGHVLDLDRYKTVINANKRTKVKSLPILMSHSVDDIVVRYEGCCAKSKCCCNISFEACNNVDSFYANWKKINGCSASKDVLTLDSSFLIDSNYTSESSIKCYTASNCQANTTFCQLTNVLHSKLPIYVFYFTHILLFCTAA